MKVDDYQNKALESDQSRGEVTARYLLLGLFGEAGGVLTAVKKRARDDETNEQYFSQVTEELGDLLWYFATVAAKNKTKLSAIVAPLLRDEGILPKNIKFSDIQKPSRMSLSDPSKFLEFRLTKLAAAVGELVRVQTQSLHTRTRTSSREAFTEVLKQLALVATRVGLSLDEVAANNLFKVQSRWPVKRKYPAPFDGGFPAYEQIPKNLTIDIQEVVPAKGSYFVLQTCNGIHVGDRLTDNIEDSDEYRFHDVFHYAYAAVLGWSPVMRSILRLKRKSNKVIDETQDGARAVLIEEGISTLIFNEAKRQSFFEGVERGKLSFDLLKTVKSFVRGYEVDVLPYWLWEEAILQGFEAFRFLQTHRAARVTISYHNHRLEVAPHP